MWVEQLQLKILLHYMSLYVKSRWSLDFFRLLLSKCWIKIYCDDHTSLSLYVNWVIYLVKIFNYKSCTTLYLGESEGLLDPVDPLGFRGWSLTKFRHEASLDSRAWIKGEVKKIITAIIKQHFSLYNKMQLERRKSTTWMRWTLNFDTCLYHPLSTETKQSVDYTSQWPYSSRGKKYTEQVIPNNMNDL